MSMEKELPEGWAITRLEDICTIITGQSPPSSEYNEDGEGLPFFQGKAEFTDLFPEARKWCTAPTKTAQPNDILLSVRAPVGPTNLAPSVCCIGRGLAAIRPEGDTEVRYVLYAIRTFNSNLVDMATGSTFEAVSGDIVRAFEIPLAPTYEQHRIVAAIEQQFSRLDAAVTFLRHARTKLKRQRAAILKAAVEGTLTADWRAQHPASETAEQLLQRILNERRAKWEADQLTKKKVYKEPESPDTTNLPELPDGWVWVSVGQVSYFVRYGTSAKTSEDDTGTPVLRMGNIQDGALELSNLKYLPTDHSEFPSLLLEVGDMLFNRTNSPELVGKSAVYHGNPPICSYASYLIVVRPLTGCLPDYLCYFLNSSFGRAWVKSVVTQQVGQANVNGSKLQALTFPLPPLSEQEQIVSEVEARLSIIAKTELEVEANLKRAERLRQTILAEAFAGRLVPQNPRDEPASVLLERIRGERDGVQKKGKAGNGRAGAAVKVPGAPVKIDMKGMEQVALWESACF